MLTGKQLSYDHVAKTTSEKRCALARPSVTESRFDCKPRWNQDGKQMAELRVSDDVIVGTTKGITTTR